ncbi:hypothetical protein AWB78_08459 [Caballeronia calidae]|uniref:Uncharacterized protein n=1 Tax=Caballeronia calidae TaxID=1777139 RepID=A0A158EK03_9BURK|nr:hypothetical protein [Caballeronia calidae]SAL07179.1 hypothetical protein AWB78_08459 [Caballeronia calidae]
MVKQKAFQMKSPPPAVALSSARRPTSQVHFQHNSIERLTAEDHVDLLWQPERPMTGAGLHLKFDAVKPGGGGALAGQPLAPATG